MLDNAVSLLAAAIVFLSLFGAGRPLLRWLRLGHHDTLEVVAWSLGLGVAASCCWLSLWALLGWLTPPAIGVYTLVAGFWGLGELACVFLGRRNDTVTPLGADIDPPPATAWRAPSRPLRLAWLGLASVAATGSLLGALAPPTSPEALSRHLELPKHVLLTGSVAGPAYNESAHAPQMLAMCYACALTLDGPVAASLVNWGLGITLALATTLLARPLVGREWAGLAGSLVLLTPGVQYHMTAPLEDIALALFTTLALVAWRRGAVEWESPRWFVVAGIMLGSALGTKAVALVFVLAISVGSFWTICRQRESRQLLLRGWLTAIQIAAFVGGIWYLRAAIQGGLLLPRQTSQNLQHLGPLLLAALPGIVVARRLRGLDLIWVVLAGYALAAWACCPHVRWWSPLAPLLALAAVWVWIEIGQLPQRAGSLIRLSLASLAISGAMLPLARDKGQFAVALGWQSREEFLLGREDIFPAALLANEVTNPESRLLSQDPRGFYFLCQVADEAVYRRRQPYESSTSNSSSIFRTLRNDGFTHVLLTEPTEQVDTEASPLGRLLDSGLDTGEPSCLKLSDYQLTDRQGTQRRYRLFALQPTQSGSDQTGQSMAGRQAGWDASVR